MKKLFIGLLIIAAGAAIFFLLEKKDKPISANNFQQQQIIGKWKPDSLHFVNDSNKKLVPGIMSMADSHLRKYQYEFTKEGSIAFSLRDSIIKDSAHYEWDKENQLVWKDNTADTLGDIFKVSRLNNDGLAPQSKDSFVLLFPKVK
ncbi:MAG: hypothetical protein ABI675_05665 [Chitinophagaceae bacterium]